MPRDRERVRRERIEHRPAPHVHGIADERRVHPFQRFAQSLRPALVAHRAAGEILHEAMDDEARRAAVLPRHAGDERIGVEAAARFIGVGARRLAGDGDVEERIRNRIGRKKGEPVEQPPARRVSCATDVAQVVASVRSEPVTVASAQASAFSRLSPQSFR